MVTMLGLGPAMASIDAPEAGTEASGATLAAVQQAVSNTVQALEGLGLALDPVEARREVRETLLRVADPGAILLSDEDTRRLKDRAEGVFYDTGLRVVATNGLPVVSEVKAGSSASEAGIEEGWILTAADGRPTADQHLPALRRMLSDLQPGEIALSFQEQAEDEERTLTLEKRATTLPSIERVEVLPLGLRYLEVKSLRAGAGREVADALSGWADEGAFGVVLDLRGAGGADLQSVADIVDLLSRPGERLFGFNDPAGDEVSNFEAKHNGTLGMPVMLLVDGETAGAAEVLAAAVSGSGRGAMLLGARTRGDPMIREKVELPNGEWAYVAARRLVAADGTVFDGKEGVKPDVVVVQRDRSYRDYEPPPPLLTDRRETTEEEKQTLELRKRTRGDVALTRAVDVLLGLKALDIHGFGFEARSSR
jgi:carboxyl-terminal processing protease